MLKSMKNALKRAKKETAALPREIEVIRAEYEDLRAKAGDTQYQIYVYTKDLARLNNKLESLNYEAASRQKIDKETATKPAKTNLATETTQQVAQ